MTAFAFDLSRDKLSIAADTAIYSVGAEARLTSFASKVFMLPRPRLMICGRGVVGIVADVYCRLAVMPIATFAEAVELLPGLLRGATDEWATAHGIEDHSERQIFEGLFGGFDREAGRARLFAAYNYQGYSLEEFPPGCGCGVIPCLPESLRPDIAGLPLRDRMMRGIRAAASYFASDPERAKGAVVGGEVEMTTITASEVSCRPIGFLPVAAPDPDAVLHDDDPLAGLTLVSELRTADAPPARSRRAGATSRSSRAAAHAISLGVGAGLGAGITLNSLLGGNKLTGSIGSGVGSLAGTAIGSIVGGPVGALAGGVIGGAGGGAFGGPLGSDKTTVSTGRITLT